MIKIFLESKETEDERCFDQWMNEKNEISFLRLTKQVRFEQERKRYREDDESLG